MTKSQALRNTGSEYSTSLDMDALMAPEVETEDERMVTKTDIVFILTVIAAVGALIYTN